MSVRLCASQWFNPYSIEFAWSNKVTVYTCHSVKCAGSLWTIHWLFLTSSPLLISCLSLRLFSISLSFMLARWEDKVGMTAMCLNCPDDLSQLQVDWFDGSHYVLYCQASAPLYAMYVMQNQLDFHVCTLLAQAFFSYVQEGRRRKIMNCYERACVLNIIIFLTHMLFFTHIKPHKGFENDQAPCCANLCGCMCKCVAL